MVERNDVPVQQWLEVWTSLDWVRDAPGITERVDHLADAVRHLLELLEPPSVRELRRADDAVLEFVEGDE